MVSTWLFKRRVVPEVMCFYSNLHAVCWRVLGQNLEAQGWLFKCCMTSSTTLWYITEKIRKDICLPRGESFVVVVVTPASRSLFRYANKYRLQGRARLFVMMFIFFSESSVIPWLSRWSFIFAVSHEIGAHINVPLKVYFNNFLLHFTETDQRFHNE